MAITSTRRTQNKTIAFIFLGLAGVAHATTIDLTLNKKAEYDIGENVVFLYSTTGTFPISYESLRPADFTTIDKAGKNGCLMITSNKPLSKTDPSYDVTKVFACKAASTSTPQSTTVRQYCNSKYNYCVSYPNQLSAQRESDGGDGRHFTLKNSPSTIAVYASNTPSALSQTDAEYLKQVKSEAHQHKIAYESLKGNRYAYSYLTPTRNIFYGWVIVKGDSDYHLEFEYSQSEKAAFDPIIKQMTQSLKTN